MSSFSLVEVYNYTQKWKIKEKKSFSIPHLPLQNVINKHSYQI